MLLKKVEDGEVGEDWVEGRKAWDREERVGGEEGGEGEEGGVSMAPVWASTLYHLTMYKECRRDRRL